jgi:hypothetical protein
LAAISRFRHFYLAHFSKPASDRAIYRAIRRHRVRKILEIGLGGGGRAVRMIRSAQRYHKPAEVVYAAIDLFEARGGSDPPGLSLKESHRLLATTGARVQLIPGDPASALARSANALGPLDLVIIAASQKPQSLERGWFYFPRMLHTKSLVFQESLDSSGLPSLVRLEHATIQSRAQSDPRRHAA